MSLGSAQQVQSQTARLAWDPSPTPNVSGYSVRYGQASQRYDQFVSVGKTTSATISNLTAGIRYFFVVTAWVSGGGESEPSNEVSFTPAGPPPPPANVPPTLDPIANLSVPVNSGPRTVPLTGITPGAFWEDQAPVVRASSSNPALIPQPVVQFNPMLDSGSLILQPVPNVSGSATITVTVDDGASLSNTVSRSFRVDVVEVATPVYSTIFVEAEAGQIAAPMTLSVSPQASGNYYIFASTSSGGTARYSLVIPQTGSYIVWCRVLSQSSGTDSFYVSVDGADEEVFDTGLETHSGAWQWTRLNERNGGSAASIRQLDLTQGTHTISFRGRESGAALDAIYVTNDPNFVPVKLSIVPVSSPVRGVEVSFRSPAGFRYSLQATEDLRNWRDLWQSAVATPNQLFAFVDSTAPASGKRFYRLVTR